MIKIGLTGNIGSGKSTVAKVFKTLGVPVFYADIEAKSVLDQLDIIIQLSSKFGKAIIDETQKIDRASLASIVFKSPDALSFLNNLIHPEVAKKFLSWTEEHTNCEYIIHEAAILYESGFNKFMDKTIYVYANHELRLKRIAQRDQISQNKILDRMRNQWDDDKKIKLADHVISNNEEDFIIPQILALHKTFSNTEK